MSSMLFLICVLSLICSISGFAPRINNGKIASSTDYVVGIKLDTFFSTYYCTGGIIHEKYILTAAHCFTKELGENPSGGDRNEYKKFKVHVYAKTDSMKKISKNAIKRTGTDVYFPKQYLENGIDDIALLKLNKNLEVGTKLLKFAPTNNNYYNRYGVIAGYGMDPENDKKNPKAERSLKTMNVKIVSSHSCLVTYRRPVIAEKHMCTQAVELNHVADRRPDFPLGVCDGDSGAPLVYQGNIVIGVVSRSVGCDGRITPELHMRVSNYMNFIDTVKNEQPIDPNHIVHHTI